MSGAGPAGTLLLFGADEIDKGGVRAVEIDGVPLAVVRTVDDTYHAVYDQCSHQQIALSEGEVEGCTLECWLHGSQFDLRTGKPISLPATEPVPVYPVEIREGNVYVTLSPIAGVDEGEAE